jgi:hypothetical protein
VQGAARTLCRNKQRLALILAWQSEKHSIDWPALSM